MHGFSGIPDDDIFRTIALGVRKVNFATELRTTYTYAVRSNLCRDGKLYDPQKLILLARTAVQGLVRHRLTVCGSCEICDTGVPE